MSGNPGDPARRDKHCDMPTVSRARCYPGREPEHCQQQDWPAQLPLYLHIPPGTAGVFHLLVHAPNDLNAQTTTWQAELNADHPSLRRHVLSALLGMRQGRAQHLRAGLPRGSLPAHARCDAGTHRKPAEEDGQAAIRWLPSLSMHQTSSGRSDTQMLTSETIPEKKMTTCS